MKFNEGLVISLTGMFSALPLSSVILPLLTVALPLSVTIISLGIEKLPSSFSTTSDACLIVILSFEITYKVKLKKCNEKKDEEFKGKIEVRDKIRELNNQISSLVVSIITINEHFYELSNITDDNILNEKWKLYSNQIIMAINKKYNYKATYSEYEEYLKDYEEQLKEKEEKQ